jgi:hypothetical protein
MKTDNKSDLLILTEHYGLMHYQCKECDFEETILSKFEGFSEKMQNSLIQLGYQCNLCGKCTRRAYYPEKTIIENFTCECGGNLDRDKPIFCPKCQCLHLNFNPVALV